MGPVSCSPPDAMDDRAGIVADLSGIDVLSDADPEDLVGLAALVTRFVAPAGTVLIRPGDAADHFLLLTAGQVEVVMGPAGAPKVAVVGAGTILGEIALVRGERTSATVTAITETRGLKGGWAAFTALIGIPGVVDRVVVSARQRLAAGLVPVPVTLPDGTRLRLRPVFPDDKRRLLEASTLASAQTRYRRFFAAGEVSPATARYLTEVDYVDHLGLVGEVHEDSGARQVAEGRWVRRAEEPDTADFAIAIADDYQHSGLGNALLDALQRSAAARRIDRLCGQVLRNNKRMSGWLEARGWAMAPDLHDPGVVCAELPLRATRVWREAA